MTQDTAKLEYFYHHMYLPYIKERFDKLSFLSNFDGMLRLFKKGQLLLVRKEDDYVSGAMLVRSGRDNLFFHSLGIKEGNIEYLQKGAITALYYFSILWAKQNGYNWMDFGSCRSFLKDGVFNYKKHWGMEIKINNRSRNVIGLKVCNDCQAVRNFFKNNPFIYLDRGKLKGFIAFDKNQLLTTEKIKLCSKNYSIPGLDCLTIVTDQEFDQKAKEFADSCSTPKIQLISMKEENFPVDIAMVLNRGNTAV
jgi:hypothetical protein